MLCLVSPSYYSGLPFCFVKKITNLRNSFILLSLMALPPILGVTGVWLAIPVAEFITLFLSAFYEWCKRNIYHYA